MASEICRDILRGFSKRCVEEFLSKNDIDSRIDEHDSTMVMIAAKHGNVEYLKYLIDKKANINLKNKYGGTALHLVIGYFDNFPRFCSRFDTCKLLVDNGADTNVPAGYNKETPLQRTITLGDDDISELLIQNGANVNAKNRLRQTPLHYAAHRGNMNMVKVLLKHGAKREVKDDNGDTPAKIAKDWDNLLSSSIRHRYGRTDKYVEIYRLL